MKILKAIGVVFGMAACFYSLGCGTTEVETLAAPSISTVLPQTIAAGSSSVTMKVVGTNFTSSAVILWNGGKLATTVVDANTLSGSIQGGSLAVPGTAQLQVQNSRTGQSSQSVPISIISSNTTVPLPLAISVPTVPQGIAGTAYSIGLNATGGTPAYTWSVTSGNFPAGLSLSASTGMISGTPTASGTYNFTVTVSDTSSPVQTQSATLSITIAPVPTVPAQLTIVTSSLAAGIDGVTYVQNLQATGGIPAYSWTVTAGSLPPGLTLAAGSGVISGVPTTSGTFPFTAAVTDSTNPTQTRSIPLSITIAATQLSIPSLTLAAGTANASYSQTLHAIGGTPAYTWTITSGALPAGLTLAAGTGLISGTPTTAGTSSFTATVTDSSNPVQTKSVALSIVIASSQLSISTSSLAAATEGATYSQTLHAAGGTPTYSWSITSGSLPAGLTLAAGSGVISGTPTVAGSFSFTATVTDASSPVQTKSVPLSITVSSPQLTITSASLAAGTNGTAYSQTLQAAGGTPAYSWTITSGALPAGLTLAAGSGLISGTPTATGTYNFTVTVTDASSPVQTKAVGLSITIASTQLAIATSSLAAASEGAAYSQTLHATGGTPAYSWSVTSGNLPAGLTLAAGSGVISGTPTVTGSFSFTATVTDASSPVQTKSVLLSITIASNQLTITTTSLNAATLATPYSQTLHATGGTPAYSWSLTGGSLPAGLTLTAGTGVIAGTPTASGTSTFTLGVSDSGNPVQTQSVTLSITVASSPLIITSFTLGAATVGTAYTHTLDATGGTQPYTWSVSSGSLPTGLVLSTAGVISGSPTTAGTYLFTITVIDSSNPTQTQSIPGTILVAPQLTAGPGTTWYIRPDGGTRFDANLPLGQCNGKVDAPYPGTGVDQPCAFNDFRYMWDDQSYNGDTAWVMQGGDTVIIEGCASNANQITPSSPQCRIGWDSNTGAGAGQTWCFYNSQAPYGCYNPPIPSGTPTQPTRILGQNYANCSNGNTTNRSALTQIFGGFGVQYVLNLAGAVNVQVECLEITEHNEAVPGTAGTCITHGSPSYPAGCKTGNPGLSDFTQNGVVTSAATSNLLLQDVYIHGHTTSGLQGPIGGAITMTRVFIGFNGFAGWNFDDGSDTPDAPNSSINASYVTMEGNGCNEQYPIANSTFPAESCYDSDSGGFGDSWSGQDTVLNSFVCNHCEQIYNTKDGFIGPHTFMNTLLIENSESIGNMGQQWKWGTNPNVGATTTFINNLTVGNCNRMSEAIPGASHSFAQSSGNPGAYLSLFCRAAGAVFSFDSVPSATTLFAFNTVVTYSATIFDQNCPASGTCGGTAYTYKDNIFLGLMNDDATYSNFQNGEAPGLYYVTDSTDTISTSNNIEFGIRNGDTCGGTIICSSPLMVGQPASPMMSETALDNFDAYPSATSPAVGAGVAVILPILTDLLGVTRPNPPSEGALEPQ